MVNDELAPSWGASSSFGVRFGPVSAPPKRQKDGPGPAVSVLTVTAKEWLRYGCVWGTVRG